jgi:hypothetical protein
MILAGETRRTMRETCPSDTVSATYPTCANPVKKPDLRGERPATGHEPWHGLATVGLRNNLSIGTAYVKAMLDRPYMPTLGAV